MRIEKLPKLRWPCFLGISPATPEFLDAKFQEHRTYTLRMIWMMSIIAVGLWIWDYVHDPMNAESTLKIRLFMGAAPAACGLALIFLKLSRRSLEWSALAAITFSNTCYFAITTMLNDGMALSPQGYMFFQIAVLLIWQCSSFSMIITGHMLTALYPHILGLALPRVGFLHLKYAIMIWPTAAACIIAQYYMYIQYENNWQLRQELEQMASYDHLTGLFNRRAFLERATSFLSLISRHKRPPLSVLMIDADHFKHINDTYGHDMGDRVLRELAGTISSNLRNTDLLCRWGGEEFLSLLPDANRAGAAVLAERLLDAVRSTRIDTGEHGVLTYTVSIGIAELTDTDGDLETLICMADNALYQAKEQGRNRIQCSI